MKYVVVLLLVSFFTFGCSSNTTEENKIPVSIEKTEPNFSKLIEITNIEIEQNYDLVKVDIKNISNGPIYGVALFLDYVGKDGKPFAQATKLISFEEIKPGYSIVASTPLSVYNSPPDEWNGSLLPEIVDVLTEPRDIRAVR